MSAEPQLKLTAAECVNKIVHALGDRSGGARPSKITTGSVVFRKYTPAVLQASTVIALEGVEFTITPATSTSVSSVSWLWSSGPVLVRLDRHDFDVRYGYTVDRTYTAVDEFIQDLQREVRILYQRRLADDAKVAELRERTLAQLSALKPTSPGDKFVFVVDSLGGGYAR